MFKIEITGTKEGVEPHDIAGYESYLEQATREFAATLDAHLASVTFTGADDQTIDLLAGPEGETPADGEQPGEPPAQEPQGEAPDHGGA